MKRFFRDIHIWLSIPLGLVVSVACFTGAALVFEKEISALANSRLYEAPHAPGQKMMAPGAVAEALQRQMPDSMPLTRLTVGKAEGEAWMASFKGAGKRQMSVNPYTGRAQGWVETPAFFKTMRSLHRHLLDSPGGKGRMSAGKFIVGVATVAMSFVLLSGVVIWWPRNRKVAANRLKVSLSKGWRRFWHDTHVSLGVYAAAFLLLMSLTGPTWSFGWYRDAAYGLFGADTSRPKDGAAAHTAKAEFEKGKGRKGGKGARKPGEEARKEGKDGARGYEIVVKGSHGKGPKDRSAEVRQLFYSLHTGTWGGTATKVAYVLAAFIGGCLPLTGYYLWIRRKFAGRRAVQPAA